MHLIKYYQMAKVVEEVHLYVNDADEQALITMTNKEAQDWLMRQVCDKIVTDETCEIDDTHMWIDSKGKEHRIE